MNWSRIIRWIGTSTDVPSKDIAELATLNATLAGGEFRKTRTASGGGEKGVSQRLLLVADLLCAGRQSGVDENTRWTEQELLNRKSDWLEHPDDHEKVIAELDSLNQEAIRPFGSGACSSRDGSIGGCRGLSSRCGPDLCSRS